MISRTEFFRFTSQVNNFSSRLAKSVITDFVTYLAKSLSATDFTKRKHTIRDCAHIMIYRVSKILHDGEYCKSLISQREFQLLVFVFIIFLNVVLS